MRIFFKNLWAPVCFLVLLGLYNIGYSQSLASHSVFADAIQLPKHTVEQALEHLEKKFKVSFHYETQTIRDAKLSDYLQDYEQENLQDALKKLLEPLDLNYRRLDEHYYLILKDEAPKKIHGRKVAPLESSIQQKQYYTSLEKISAFQYALSLAVMDQTISGKVTDAKSGEGIPGVNVLAKGTTTGTVTDVDGQYRLTVDDNVTTLVFSSIGYTTVEIPINGRTTIDMALEEDIQSLDEIVVIGYGTQKRSDLTGAVGSVNVEELQQRPVPSLNQAIAGRIPGVQVNVNSGRPGGKSNVRIRGFSSINSSNNPLYVVDGVQLPMTTQTQRSQAIDYINPNDIVSVEVLKDASSTAILRCQRCQWRYSDHHQKRKIRGRKNFVWR